MFLRAALSFALAMAAASGAGLATTGATAATPAASSWAIGPIIRGRNYSVGMPLRPTPRRGGGFQIDLPRAPGSAHYVTFPHGSLAGKSRIVMRYRVEAAPGVRIAPPSSPQGDGLITLYFQRAGDTWSGRRQFEAFRWSGTFATQTIRPGEQSARRSAERSQSQKVGLRDPPVAGARPSLVLPESQHRPAVEGRDQKQDLRDGRHHPLGLARRHLPKS